MNNSCIFCKIINKEINSVVVKETKNFIVINDINPQNTTHLLIIPKKHSQDLNEFIDNNEYFSEYMQLVRELSISLKSPHYKVQINTGKKEGQIIFHFHTHFISSSKLN